MPITLNKTSTGIFYVYTKHLRNFYVAVLQYVAPQPLLTLISNPLFFIKLTLVINVFLFMSIMQIL